MSGPSVTASESEAVRRASPWASMVCIPVLFLTLVPYWIYNVVWWSGSVMGFYRDFMDAVKSAMDHAGAAVIIAVMIWRRVSASSRRILGLCVIANLYTLFVVTGQRLDYVERQFFDPLPSQTCRVMRWVALEAFATADSRQVDVGSCVEEVLAGVRDAWGRRIWVLSAPNGGVGQVVSLASSGADGVEGTADDLRLSTPR